MTFRTDGKLCSGSLKAKRATYNRLMIGSRPSRSTIRLLSQVVTTLDSQSGNAGSIPAGAAKFDPLTQMVENLTFNQGGRSSSLRWITKYGSVIQLSRIPDCLSGGCGFESRPSRHMGRWCSGSTVVCGSIRASSNLALPSK